MKGKDKDLESKLRSVAVRRPSSSYVDKVLAQKPERLEAQIKPRWYGRRIWIYGPIAAAVLGFAMVAVLYLFPGGEPGPGSAEGVVKDDKVEIPAELAQTPLKKLFELHFGKAETSFDSKTVAAAVKVALDRLSAREVLDIGRKYSGQRGMSAERMPYYPPALSKIVKGSDFVIWARVETVTLDVDDLKAAIVKKQTNRLSIFIAFVRAIVDLHVLEGYPSLPPLDGEKLTLWPVLSTEKLDAFKAGEEYLIALQQDGDIIWMLPYAEGLYPVDANSGFVSGFRNGPMSLDEAWQFIMDMFDAIHEDIEPSGEILDYWLARLQSEDLMECWTAVEYFGTLAAKPPAAAELVMGAFERHYNAIVEERRGREDKSLDFEPATLLKDALDLLWRVGDESTVDKMLALYEKDRASAGSILNADESKVGMHARGFTERMVRLALKNPGPKRRERFLQLFPKPGDLVIEELGRTEGEDIDQLLLDMLKNPGSFGISRAHDLRAVWSALARRGNAEIGPYLRRFIADPQNTDLGVHYSDDTKEAVRYAYRAFQLLPQDAVSRKRFLRSIVDYYYKTEDDSGSTLNLAINALDDLLEPGDMEFNSLLREQVTNHWKVPILIAERAPDPCFVPVLRQALEKEVTGTLIAALFACGEEEEAIEMAVTELDKLLDEENGQMLGGRLYKLFPVIRFLGTTGDESVLPVTENFTREDVIDTLRETDARFGGQFAFIVDKLQQDAVLALAKLGGESVIPRLKELYESEDIYIQLLAAVSLYALGDDAGYELLEHFVNRTERSVPEIEMRWHIDMYGGRPFEEAVRYLKSPRTDALLQERRHHKPDSSD